MPAVSAALAALTPARAWPRYRLRAGFALVLAFLLVPFGILGLPLIVLGREYWKRRVPIPGLSPSDSRAWRRIGALPLRPGRNVLEPADGVSAAEILTFGLLGGLGYDVRVGKNLSITPVANYFRGAFDGGSANVLQLGVGVTSH